MFGNNNLISYFDELEYFTNITSLNNYCFRYSTIIGVRSSHITNFGGQCLQQCHYLRYAFFPSLTYLGSISLSTSYPLKYIKLGQLTKNNNLTNSGYLNQNAVYIALYLTSIPSWVTDTNPTAIKKTSYLYVPDEFLDELKESYAFNSIASKMRPLSELEADAITNGWDY